MSATTSAATGRCFGIQRVCQVWERSRSALYAWRARAHHRLGAGPARRGPPPRQSDAQLLAAIRTDLARSPFHGEGHRKVHARLRILDGIRVARTRVLRVMRAHGLLSPHRGRQGAAKTHDGRVITQAPNVMWGTDGVRVFTLDDGWGWIFAAVEHWNAECVGWHVCKVGSRFAALDPIAQGLERLYGSLDADVARGLALRMDHGSQYLSDHFLKQIRYWGIHPSFGFVEEPETNGVAERWNRTLKEQAIHGRIFQNLEAVRAAVADFVERYNQTWRLEKLGITRRSRRARSMGYARRHSTNVCPGNRVRYSAVLDRDGLGRGGLGSHILKSARRWLDSAIAATASLTSKIVPTSAAVIPGRKRSFRNPTGTRSSPANRLASRSAMAKAVLSSLPVGGESIDTVSSATEASP